MQIDLRIKDSLTKKQSESDNSLLVKLYNNTLEIRRTHRTCKNVYSFPFVVLTYALLRILAPLSKLSYQHPPKCNGLLPKIIWPQQILHTICLLPKHQTQTNCLIRYSDFGYHKECLLILSLLQTTAASTWDTHRLCVSRTETRPNQFDVVNT